MEFWNVLTSFSNPSYYHHRNGSIVVKGSYLRGSDPIRHGATVWYGRVIQETQEIIRFLDAIQMAEDERRR